jgi:hypothetical protein
MFQLSHYQANLIEHKNAKLKNFINIKYQVSIFWELDLSSLQYYL